ncbi:LIC_10190 family membrane protein [Chryseobacterium sp. PTM-20240506]|uniref:LIC_10190 family membrane protein n=1 Tax=unclassified Chryseobacterium TaxID=2593645 RepID=UPI0023592837|nr:hypothetical protein [Chryseobacterium sp. B21-037]MDC8105313.1 hypothetical protein [Chryseobacterium sp. B21-037]
MILMLFSSVIIISTLLGWGKIMDMLSGTLFSGISGKAFSGIFIISVIWTLIAFFIPLNINVEITTIAIGLFFFFKNKLYLEYYGFSKKDMILLTAIVSIILFCGSYYPYILDHFGYYVPSIKWLTEYGLVKGISNLDLTLGQMSVWHIFQAGFSNFSDPFLRINVIILIIYAFYIIEKKSWIQLGFLPVMLLFSQSPSPDLPVIIFSLIILNEILSENKKSTLLFALSVFIFTIKPTMIWLPVLSLLYSVFIIKSSVKNIFLGIVILILFFVKNIWTFGYPVFPIAFVDLGISWKTNPEILKRSSQFAIQKTYDMQYTFEEIQKFSSIDYIKNWLFLKGIKAKINILFIVTLLLLILYSVRKKNRVINIITISIIIKTILVLLFSAQYRFFIDVFFIVAFILLSHYINRSKSIAIFLIAGACVIFFFLFPSLIATHIPSYKMARFMGKFEKKQIYQPSVYQYTPFRSFRIGNLIFNVPENYPYSFGTPLPSMTISYIIDNANANIFPQPINKNNIREGFVWKTMNMKEKKEAMRVINIIINNNKQN